jgi:hypothetical protein
MNGSEVMRQRGQANTDTVRTMLVTFPGITNREISERTGINVHVVGRHVRKIRKEWNNGTE